MRELPQSGHKGPDEVRDLRRETQAVPQTQRGKEEGRRSGQIADDSGSTKPPASM